MQKHLPIPNPEKYVGVYGKPVLLWKHVLKRTTLYNLAKAKTSIDLSMDPRIFAGAPSGLKNSFGLNVLSNIPVYQYFSVKNVRFGLLWVRARPANRFSIAVAL